MFMYKQRLRFVYSVLVCRLVRRRCILLTNYADRFVKSGTLTNGNIIDSQITRPNDPYLNLASVMYIFINTRLSRLGNVCSVRECVAGDFVQNPKPCQW